jgi:hypothetical protein
MLTRRFMNIYGIVGIIVMSVLLVLVLFKIVPVSYYLPLFVVAFVIWVSRMVMRVILARKERSEAVSDNPTSIPPP